MGECYALFSYMIFNFCMSLLLWDRFYNVISIIYLFGTIYCILVGITYFGFGFTNLEDFVVYLINHFQKI